MKYRQNYFLKVSNPARFESLTPLCKRCRANHWTTMLSFIIFYLIFIVSIREIPFGMPLAWFLLYEGDKISLRQLKRRHKRIRFSLLPIRAGTMWLELWNLIDFYGKYILSPLPLFYRLHVIYITNINVIFLPMFYLNKQNQKFLPIYFIFYWTSWLSRN